MRAPPVLVLLFCSSLTLAAAQARAAGGLDPSFGTSGLVQAPYGDASDVARQSSGSLVMLASDASFSFRASRFDEDGAPDGTFATAGTFAFPLGSAVGAFPAALHVDASDRIVVVGTYFSGEDQDQIMVVRLTAARGRRS